jgi:hypothetical protein
MMIKSPRVRTTPTTSFSLKHGKERGVTVHHLAGNLDDVVFVIFRRFVVFDNIILRDSRSELRVHCGTCGPTIPPAPAWATLLRRSAGKEICPMEGPHRLRFDAGHSHSRIIQDRIEQTIPG